MQSSLRCCAAIFFIAAVVSMGCSTKTEPGSGAGHAGSNGSRTATPTVDCTTARNNAATAWETWATSIDLEKINNADSHTNLLLLSEAAAQGGESLNADDQTKTRALSAKATLTKLAAVDQAYAPTASAAREAALEMRTPQGASKHVAALQQARALLDAEQAFDQHSLDVAAAAAASIEILDLPAAALDHPGVKAKLDAIKAKRTAAIASVDDLRKSQLEKIANERKTIDDLETAFAPCVK